MIFKFFFNNVNILIFYSYDIVNYFIIINLNIRFENCVNHEVNHDII